MMKKSDRRPNALLVATPFALLLALIGGGCGVPVCNLSRPQNVFLFEFTEGVSSYEATIETGTTWLRSGRKMNPLTGDEENAVIFTPEAGERKVVEARCVDGQLETMNEYVSSNDCSNGLRWIDGSYVPLDLRITLDSEVGIAEEPAEGMVQFERVEVLENDVGCFTARGFGRIVVDTSAL